MLPGAHKARTLHRGNSDGNVIKWRIFPSFVVCIRRDSELVISTRLSISNAQTPCTDGQNLGLPFENRHQHYTPADIFGWLTRRDGPETGQILKATLQPPSSCRPPKRCLSSTGRLVHRDNVNTYNNSTASAQITGSPTSSVLHIKLRYWIAL